MKKSLIALAALAATGAAMAQSSVTLYGVLDTGLTYSKGAESVYGLTHVGGNVNSRLGFRGVEDLGNGLKATFNLEAGIGVDDGTDYFTGSGMAFRRTSTVGLEGDFGSVRLGRMLTSSYMAVSRYDAFGDTGIGATRAWARTYPSRTENAISYTSANLNGFKFGVEYGFGEKTEARLTRYVGFGATYDNGPLSLGFGADRINNAGYAAAVPAGTNPVTNPVPEKLGKDQTTWQLGGAYNFGAAKLLGFYKHTDEKTVASGNKDKYKSFGLGVTAPVGAGEVKVAYNHYRLNPNAGKVQKANQLSLGYVHNLSKRTALYGTYAYLKNDKKNSIGLELNGAMAGAGLTKKGAQHGLQLGIRHAF